MVMELESSRQKESGIHAMRPRQTQSRNHLSAGGQEGREAGRKHAMEGITVGEDVGGDVIDDLISEENGKIELSSKNLESR